MTKPLAPYAKQWIESPPAAGLWVAIGPGAWDLASSKSFPVCVLPPDSHARDYSWPRVSGSALIMETGACNDDALYELAEQLLYAGAPCVVAIRKSILKSEDSVLYFQGVDDVE